jgi:hypothetical protein
MTGTAGKKKFVAKIVFYINSCTFAPALRKPKVIDPISSFI